MKLTKKIGIGICIFLFTILWIASANAVDNSSLVAYFSFDTSLSQDDFTGTYSGSTEGNPVYQTTGCKEDHCYEGDGTGDAVLITGLDSFVENTYNFTVCAWIKHDVSGTDTILGMTNDAGGTDNSYSLYEVSSANGGGIWQSAYKSDVRTRLQDQRLNTAGTMNFLCAGFNTTHLFNYYNGTFSNSTSWTGPTDLTTMSLRIGASQLSGSPSSSWDGLIDEMSFWNTHLSSSQINDLYNSGSGCYLSCINTGDAPPENNTAPEISLVTPTNNDIFNTTYIIFNATVTSEFEYNCSLYLDEVLNETQTNISNTTTTVLFNKTLNEGTYNYSYSCINEIGETNSSTYDFIVWTSNVTTTHSYSSLTIGQNITITCNGSLTPDNTTYVIYNNNDSILTEQVSNIYTLQNTDFLNQLDTYCYQCINSECRYSNTNNTILENLITFYINFNILNDLNEVIPWSSIYFNHSGLTKILNPSYLEIATNFLNNTVTEFNSTLNVTDLSYKTIPAQFNITINETTPEFNLTLNLVQLYMGFSEPTDGVIIDSESVFGSNSSTLNWTNSSLIVVQQNLALGDVMVLFNMNNLTNQTQYYEYINNHQTNIIEEIQIMQNPEHQFYFKFTDLNNKPIEDVQVRFEIAETTNGITNFTLATQRLTKQDGTNFVFLDSGTQIHIIWTKSGYVANEIILSSIDETETSKDNPQSFIMEEDASTIFSEVVFRMPKLVYELNESIIGTTITFGYQDVEWTTQYAEDQGIIQQTVCTLDNWRCLITLNPGIHYDNTSYDDIITKLYINDVNVLNRTTEISSYTKTNLLTLEDIDSSIINIGLAILLLVITLAMGMITRNQNAGTATFLLGSVAMGFLSTTFWLLSAVVLIYYAAKLVNRVMSE
jgi:hypothetical protein